MTGQNLELGKFITDQVANTFGHIQRPSVISTPEAGLENTHHFYILFQVLKVLIRDTVTFIFLIVLHQVISFFTTFQNFNINCHTLNR